jgi:hypothetical protein
MTVFVVLAPSDVVEQETDIIAIYADRSSAEAKLLTSTFTSGRGETLTVHSYYWIEEHTVIEQEVLL